jgi:DNA (cytosine-5)-methyltransferase 1
MRLATVFSGIGSIEQALKKMNVPFKTVFACDNGERELDVEKSMIIEKNPYKKDDINRYINELYSEIKKPNYVKMSYFANHDTNDTIWYEDVRFINGYTHKDKIDLLVGGSPCQSFSIIGKRGGLEDSRGSLILEFIRLVYEIRPSVFIFENVKGLLTHDKGNTIKTIMKEFTNLGYGLNVKILNSMDYGIPQNRSRLFIVGFKNHGDFKFPNPIELKTTLFDYLEKNIDKKYYLGKKGFEFVTNPKYKNRARTNRKIISTQKANQQFNWNGDFVMEKYDMGNKNHGALEKAYKGFIDGQEVVIRKLTPRECLRLMGFDDSFKIVVPDKELYRQAGNSIVVNVLEEILKQVMKVIEFDEKT